MSPHAINGETQQSNRENGLPTTADPSDIRVLASSRAIIEDRLEAATIVVSSRTGKITEIFPEVRPASSFPSGTIYHDYSPSLLMPGLVDAHVHLNEPGRTEWEGFWTGTRAAAFGGVTTIIDMPLNCIPPTTTMAGLEAKVAAAKGKCWVDVGFYGGIVPGNLAELKPLVRAGVRGFKGFMIDSGVDEFPKISTEEIGKVFEELADEPTTVMFHAEMVPPNPAIVDHMEHADENVPEDLYQTFLESRPSELETCAISEILSQAHLAPNLPLHIVHLSAAEAIPMLRDARVKGVKITSETCFHYLCLAAEDIRPGDTRHKCCPPIRSQSNQDELWEETLRMDSVIKSVVSDHSPCTPNLKLLGNEVPGYDHSLRRTSSARAREGNFMTAWGGISSVGLGLSIIWTECLDRGLDKEHMLISIANLCSRNTALQVGLEHKKGQLKAGLDADVIVFDDAADFEVEESTMLFRNKLSPYEGKVLKGVVRETWLRGIKVHSRETGFEEKGAPFGELILEPRVKAGKH